MSHWYFLVPGSIDRPTGGSQYDRHIAAGLQALGMDLEVVELPGAFPQTDSTAQKALTDGLAALPDASAVIIDGLVFGALPEAFAQHADRLSLIALIHHPLSDETGLDSSARMQFLASEAQALALATGVIATSDFTARRLAELGLYNGQVYVIPPGAERRAQATGSGLTPTNWQLLCIGSLIPRKAQHVLIEALATIKARSWQCQIIGSNTLNPAYAEQLSAQILTAGLSDRVQLWGTVSDTERDHAYASADLFILPSVYEGYGMVITEAIAHGLPVITTTGGALAETLPSQAGLSVAPGDASALARALHQVMSDVALAATLRAGAHKARQQLIGWQARVQQFHQALEALIDHA